MVSSEPVTCDHKVDRVGGKQRLKILCERCDRDFDPVDCISGILRAMIDTYDIGFIVISDYTEERLSDEQIDILIKMKDIMEEIESFSTRVTDGENCDGCDIFPSKIYPDLRKNFVNNPGMVYEELPKMKKLIDESERCTTCEEDLRHELNHLMEDALDLRSEILAEGFGIRG